MTLARKFQRLREAQILTRRVGDHLIEVPAHGRQAELIQFQMKGRHEIPF